MARERTNTVEREAPAARRRGGLGFARSAAEVGDREFGDQLPVRAQVLLSLQQRAGNRAVTGLVQRWRSAEAGHFLQQAQGRVKPTMQLEDAGPSSRSGPRATDEVLRLQRAVGNAAVTAVLQQAATETYASSRQPGPGRVARAGVGVVSDSAAARATRRSAPVTSLVVAASVVPSAPTVQAPLQRAKVKIGDEKIMVSDKKKKEEVKQKAEEIIKEIKNKYGIRLDSKATVQQVKQTYYKIDLREKVKTRKWRLEELRALRRALEYYKPILGAKREQSTRAGSPQEVLSVGRASGTFDENEPAHKFSTTALGEYFVNMKNIGLFTPSEGLNPEWYSSEEERLTHIFVHEAAHGLLRYARDDFNKSESSGGYWRTKDFRSEKPGVEAPCTGYHPNAEEDLCEAAAMYFVNPTRLEDGKTGVRKGEDGNACPLRYAFMEGIGKGWLPAPSDTHLVKESSSSAPPPVGGAAMSARRDRRARASVDAPSVGSVKAHVEGNLLVIDRD